MIVYNVADAEAKLAAFKHQKEVRAADLLDQRRQLEQMKLEQANNQLFREKVEECMMQNWVFFFFLFFFFFSLFFFFFFLLLFLLFVFFFLLLFPSSFPLFLLLLLGYSVEEDPRTPSEAIVLRLAKPRSWMCASARVPPGSCGTG